MIELSNPEQQRGMAELEQFYRRKALDYYEKAVNCLNAVCLIKPPTEQAVALAAYHEC